jgi:predicted nucleotidyltransferase
MSLNPRLADNLAAIRALVASHRAANPRLFGSQAQGRAREGSDVDILVDALPGATLFDLGGLQVALEDLLGMPVDLVTPGDISPAFRARVLREALPL